jgi:hypothetical protein
LGRLVSECSDWSFRTDSRFEDRQKEQLQITKYLICLEVYRNPSAVLRVAFAPTIDRSADLALVHINHLVRVTISHSWLR